MAVLNAYDPAIVPSIRRRSCLRRAMRAEPTSGSAPLMGAVGTLRIICMPPGALLPCRADPDRVRRKDQTGRSRAGQSWAHQTPGLFSEAVARAIDAP